MNRPLEIQLLEKNRYRERTAYFRNKGGNDTLTDVMFFDENTLVIANREDRILYLVRIDVESGRHQVLDRIDIKLKTTLMCKVGNTVYCAFLNNYLGVFEVCGDRIRTRGYIPIQPGVSYHSVVVHPDDPNLLYLPSSGRAIHTLTIYNVSTQEYRNVDLPKFGMHRTKDCLFLEGGRICVLFAEDAVKDDRNESIELTPSSHVAVYDSTFNLVSSHTIPNSQVDCVARAGGKLYVTCQSDWGSIEIFSEEGGRLSHATSFRVDDFPHGCDVSPPYIAYACFTTSKVFVRKLSDLEESRSGERA